MRAITTYVLPLPIVQNFSRLLLSLPSPKFKDDEEDILNILKYVRSQLWKKLDKCPGQKIKCEQLYNEILEMYESIKTQKEDHEAKTEFVTEQPFYHFKCAKRSHHEILSRHKYKARAFCESRETNKV